MAEGLSAIEVTSLATRFYESGSSALLEYGGLLGQIAGDEVMALFVPGLATDAYRSKAVQAGRALLKALGYGSPERNWVEAGVGIASGEEFVGNVMGGGYKDFTALGNVTNTAARLTSIARVGRSSWTRRPTRRSPSCIRRPKRGSSSLRASGLP
jgi:adenylate cyclase